MTLTVGPEEGWREEALVHQSRERNNSNHVVGVKGQTAERLTAQLLRETTIVRSERQRVRCHRVSKCVRR